MHNTTCVIVHHDTERLLRECCRSLLSFYPDIPLVIIDGGSRKLGSMNLLGELETRENTRVLYQKTNVGHGPGMAIGIETAQTPYVLTLDSDCICQAGGFIEQMTGLIEADEQVYASGKMRWVDMYGKRRRFGEFHYCHPVTAIWDRVIYSLYPPFELHGSPCLRNQVYAGRDGWRAVDFPVDDYVFHIGQGTRLRHGVQWSERGPIK